MAKLDRIPSDRKNKIWNAMISYVRKTIAHSDEETIVEDLRRACDTAGWILFSQIADFVVDDDE